MPKATARANARKSAVRAHVEHVFAQQKDRMGLFVLGEAIREDDEELAEARQQAREQRRHARQSDRLKLTTGTSAVTAQAEPARKVLWQLRRVYDWDGRAAERDRQALALARWGTLKENRNRRVERAGEGSVHVIYTKSYKKLRQELTAMADDDLYLDERASSEPRAVILRLDRAEEGRAHVEKHHDLIAGRLEHRREVLQFGDSWDKRAVPDREHYEAWRDGTDEAAATAEGVLANRRKYGIHLDGMAHRGEGLASALSLVRQVLADDDRHIAASLVSQRRGRGPAGARGPHRPSSRRSRQAPGDAQAARGRDAAAAGRRAAAQGPISEPRHEHVERRGTARCSAGNARPSTGDAPGRCNIKGNISHNSGRTVAVTAGVVAKISTSDNGLT